MATRRLVITRDDEGQFFLQLDGDALSLGSSPEHADARIQSFRVVRIHCELEGEGGPLQIQTMEAGKLGPAHEVQPDERLNVAGCQLHFEASADDEAPETLEVEGEPGPTTNWGKRLFVIDGGDQGQFFALPASGTITLGKDRKLADIVLNDLYVARVHCRLEIDGDKVTVLDVGSLGTLINGKKITRQEMKQGDVLRLGNSHLRLQAGVAGEGYNAAAKDDGAATLGVRKDSSGADKDEESEEADDEVGAASGTEEEIEPLPANASEPARKLHVWRSKAPQLSGQSFGHYRLGPSLGRGRCGVVFRAEDLKSNQAVAIKLLSPQFPQNDEEVQRFSRVFKGMLTLRHPNLVALHGAGKTGNYTWIVREYVEGDSLARILKRPPAGRKLDVRRACRVAVDVGTALEFARKHNYRHGQITPANILIQRKDRTAKLADLMLSTALLGSHLLRAALETRPLAELTFLSPEQSDPGAFVDDLSDLYGLGAVLYTLLAGRPPFVADTAIGVLEQIRGPARAARPSTLNAAVPAPLEQIVMKLLAKRQEDRYQTPAQLMADLGPVAAKHGVEVRAP